MNRRTASRGVMGVVLIAIVCWLASIAHAGPEQVTPIRYAYLKVYDPVYVGIEKGFFKKAGVSVEATGSFTSGPASIQGAAAGQVDAGLAATTAIIGARNAGIQVRGVTDAQTEFQTAPLQRFYVKAGSDIRTVRDLKGKTIAVNSTAASFYYALLAAFDRSGVSKSDVRFAVMPFPLMQQALLSGQVDAAGMIDPFNKRLEADGGARKLFNAVEFIGERQFSLTFFPLDFLAKNETSVRRFVAGYRKAIIWSRDNPRLAAGIMWKYIGVEPKYIARHRFVPGAGVRMKDAQYWLDMMRREGALRDGGKLTPASIATVRYAGAG